MSEAYPARHPRALPPEAVVLSFVDAINRRDLDALCDLMTPEHELRIPGEEARRGRAANRAAWRIYFGAFPLYVIYPERIGRRGDTVAILGSTTGSHLDLPDETERALRLIWRAEVADGRVASWEIIHDSADARDRWGLG